MKFNTLNELLLSRAKEASTSVSFWKKKGGWETIHYGQFLVQAQKIARFLISSGLKKSDRVALVLPTHPDFYYAFFGVLLAGGVPAAVYPPVRLGKIEEWKKRTTEQIRAISAQAVLTNRILYPLLGTPIANTKPPLGCHNLGTILSKNQASFAVPIEEPKESDLAVVQFSSGTTGASKPVALTHHNILSNAQAFINTLPGDPTQHSCVSWLPLYHDMGLVGCLVSALLAPGKLYLIPPEQFIARPKVWLEAISSTQATVSVAPNFAYGLCADRISTKDMDGLDLSHWQVALCGAEPVQASTFKKFYEKFSATGFHQNAFTPVYGLSEATLAVCFSAIKASPRWESFELDQNNTQHRAHANFQASQLACLGKPLENIQIEIRDEKENTLAEKKIGEIWVKSPGVMAGYLEGNQLTQTNLKNGWLKTGDRGFQFQGELFLCGRIKDLILIRGQNYDPHEIESCLDGLPGIRTGCSVAFSQLNPNKDTEELVLLTEYREKELTLSIEDLKKEIQKLILSQFQLQASEINLLTPGTLPRTSSGKLKRQEAKLKWQREQLIAPQKVSMAKIAKEYVAGYLKQI